MEEHVYDLDDYEAVGALRDGKLVIRKDYVRAVELADGMDDEDGVAMVKSQYCGVAQPMQTHFNVFSKEKRWRVVPRTLTVELSEDEAEDVRMALGAAAKHQRDWAREFQQPGNIMSATNRADELCQLASRFQVRK